MLIDRAVAPLKDIVRTIEPGQLDAKTPCTEYDVRRLLNHLLFWAPSLAGAGRKELVLPPAEAETAVDLTGGEWPATLEAQVDGIVTAWRAPGAWDGTTHMGSPAELPAALVGGMITGELVVHGWDLAQAIGRPFAVDEELAAYLYDEVSKTARQGRELGVYGPEVEVPASAPTLDRVLGLTGRDPAGPATGTP